MVFDLFKKYIELDKNKMTDVFVPLMKKLKQNKPKVSQSTLDAYHSSLRILYKNVVGSEAKSLDDMYKLFFTKQGMRRVVSVLDKVKKSLRKSRLASIIALCENGTKNEKEICDIYRDRMINDIKATDNEDEKQEKSDKQEKNWKSMEELQNKYEELKQKTTPLWKKKAESITKKEYDTLQKYVIASLFILQAPRRIKDYTDLVWKKDDEKNYIDTSKKEFVFNSYKTAKTYGEQRVDVNDELLKILKKWEQKKKAMRIRSDYVFSDRDGTPYTQPNFTRELNSIFGKGISASMIRHIYLSEKYKDMPAMKEMEKTAEELGHSKEQMLKYIKKD